MLSEQCVICVQYESDESDNDLDIEDSEDQVKKSDLCPAYKSLIAIHAGKPKGGIDDALRVEKDKVRRLSLAEQALEKATERYQQDIVRYVLVTHQERVINIFNINTM